MKINKYLAPFTNRIRIIIGIPEDRIRSSVYANVTHDLYRNIEADIQNRAPKLYNSLSRRSQHLWLTRRIQLFTPLAGAIHSKFYVLSSSKTGASRVILSARPTSRRRRSAITSDSTRTFS